MARAEPAGGVNGQGREASSTGVHWRSPQVLLSLLVCLAALVYALRSGPPPSEPAPTLTVDAADLAAPPLEETVLYAVDEEGLARPIVRELAVPSDPSARLQVLIDALRAEMMADDAWPAALPAPTVYAFTLERDRVAVLDLPAHEARLNVARERAILASLERTLLEHGIERIAYLRDGRAVPAWLGTVAVPSGLD